VAFIGLLIPSLSLSQSVHDECPEGFRYAGTLKGNGSLLKPLNTRVEIKLPDGATLETAYQQASIIADNGQSNRSKLRPQDIPSGIHIAPDVQNDLNKSWAISDPTLKEHQTPWGKTQYVFGMRLSCTISEYARQFGDCAVNVDVCYMPKK
jgi:hypothetical protein